MTRIVFDLQTPKEEGTNQYSLEAAMFFCLEHVFDKKTHVYLKWIAVMLVMYGWCCDRVSVREALSSVAFHLHSAHVFSLDLNRESVLLSVCLAAESTAQMRCLGKPKTFALFKHQTSLIFPLQVFSALLFPR